MGAVLIAETCLGSTVVLLAVCAIQQPTTGDAASITAWGTTIGLVLTGITGLIAVLQNKRQAAQLESVDKKTETVVTKVAHVERQTDVVAAKVEVAAEKAEVAAVKADESARQGSAIHRLVNGKIGQLLHEKAAALRRVAELTMKTDDLIAAEEAERQAKIEFKDYPPGAGT